jgi:hypothetical protein
MDSDRAEYPEPALQASPRSEPRPARPVPAGLEKYKDILLQIGGTSKARILTSDDAVVAEVPVRELVETLKSDSKGAKTIVFDGIITQRILDIASEKGIRSVVGTKMGTVVKQPTGIEVATRDDFA